MGSKFGVRMTGISAEEMTMGGLDIGLITKEVDIYLRAGQTPKVVVRPNLDRLQAVLEDAKVVVSPEVAVMLQEMGWLPPEEAGPLKDALDQYRVHGVQCDKRTARLEEDLTDARGRLADLEEVNQGLKSELAEAQRELAHRLPYAG